MTMNLTYPGVYIQEVDPGVRTIAGVATSITAFIGRARRGPLDEPLRIASFADYGRRFGGLWEDSPMSYSVNHFFLNGGGDALIVRVHNPSAADADDRATLDLPGEGGGDALLLAAADPGRWGDNLRATVDFGTPAIDPPRFNLLIEELDPLHPDQVVAQERYVNLEVDPAAARSVQRVLEQQSRLVRVREPLPDVRPAPADRLAFANGDDGQPIDADQISDPNLEAPKRGLWALDRADLFNLLCIPPFTPDDDVTNPVWTAAAEYCRDRRAVLLVDPPREWDEPDDVIAGMNAMVGARENAALYFPRIRAADALRENLLTTFAPSGAVAGVIARTDASRGLWKSPAGQEATIAGARELTVRLTDNQNGQLNPLGVNCLRSFAVPGRVVWGARTLAGSDQLASQWKYLAVRRVALYIEESLFRGTQWVVFEPNDERLWAQIRLNLTAFMHDLFRQGAFQGISPREAYFVHCDSQTTTQSDIDRGIVNIVVGFAPLKPAEFVVIRIQQMTSLAAQG